MKTSSDPRHLHRRKIIQELFAWDAQHQLKGNDQGKTPKSQLDQKTVHIISRLSDIDNVISQCAPEWEINKVNQIDLAILRLAVFELLIDATQPAKVIVDESVELAKEFGSEQSPSFINGALGKVFYLPERIKKIVAVKLGYESEIVEDAANLYTDLNASELEISDLVTYLEKEYNLNLGPVSQIKTVKDVVDMVQEQND